MSLTLSSLINEIKNIGPKREKILTSSGIKTVEELLYYFPIRYEDWRYIKNINQIVIGKMCCLKVYISKMYIQKSRDRRFCWLIITVSDDIGEVELRFANQNYLTKVLKIGELIILRGIPQLDTYNSKIFFSNPDYYVINDKKATPEGTIFPVYRKIKSISSKIIMEIIRSAFEQIDIKEPADKYFFNELNIKDKIACLREIHFPSAHQDIEALENYRTEAQIKLIFEEFYYMQLGLAYLNISKKRNRKGIKYIVDDEIREFARSILPFKLTTGQKKAIYEIVEDMKKPYPMNRLLQGDVGSGKTIVALMAMLICIHNGYQTALMAPTEILAEQHYININNILKDSNIKVELLVRNLNKGIKEKALYNISNGIANITIGTHALIQDNVKFSRLGFVVIDEQHRFGVSHREMLQKKGIEPDVLVVTATPIPRSLALTIYGDLDVSIINVFPKGRKPVKTIIKKDTSRSEVYNWLANELKKGKQAYIVCPLIEESESIQAKAAVELYEFLQDSYLKDFKLGLVHGNIEKDQREATMGKFLNKELNALVATTVIEVGIDVPNASIMIIEHAERFGLSQLHQLRGRVGRSNIQSYCILIVPSKISQPAMTRLHIIKNSNDGFEIAERDLQMRGAGELAGYRQSGFFDLKIANMERDKDMLLKARETAYKFILNLFEQNKESEFEKYFMRDWLNKYYLLEIS